MSGPSPRLRAVRIAEIQGIPGSVRLYGLGHCVDVAALPVFAFLVERDGFGPLLFDTGCAPPTRAASHGHPPVDPTTYRGAGDAVRALGVDPSSVTTVVLSHLHWDHCFGLTAFPAAEILVQRRELQAAFAPYPEYHRVYESFELGLRPHWTYWLARIRPLDGWTDLGGGVAVVPLPGHTDGSQGLVVASERAAPWCCVGDLFAGYENWTGLRHQGGRPTGAIPNGLHTDLADWRRSVETVARSGWTPLPAHDARVVSVLDGRAPPRHGDPASLDAPPA